MEICVSDKDTFIKGRYNVLSDKKTNDCTAFS